MAWQVGGCQAPRVEQRQQLLLRSLNCGGGMHGRHRKSKEKLNQLHLMLAEVGRSDVILLQHTGVQTKSDARRVTRLFGDRAVGIFAATPNTRWVASVAVIYPEGAENVTRLITDGR
eukprot:SAG11_NODE_12847_length_682_cov_2.065180_1_plen_117_part_00